MHIRHKSLDTAGKWPHGYTCCQNTVPACMCFKPGEMGEADNAWPCLCLEAWLCTGCSMSGSYGFVMGEWGLENDPCYNKYVPCKIIILGRFFALFCFVCLQCEKNAANFALL